MCARNCTDTIGGGHCLSGGGERPLGERVRQLSEHFSTLLAEWRRRARSRRYLAEMSGHDLHDIGFSRATADHEANLPFWRAGAVGNANERFPKAVAIARNHPFD